MDEIGLGEFRDERAVQAFLGELLII